MSKPADSIRRISKLCFRLLLESEILNYLKQDNEENGNILLMDDGNISAVGDLPQCL